MNTRTMKHLNGLFVGLVTAVVVWLGLDYWFSTARPPSFEHPKWAQGKWRIESEVSSWRAKPGYSVWSTTGRGGDVTIYALIAPNGDVVGITTARTSE